MNICVSPAPTSGRTCSPLSRAGCHLCPDCLGCEEPDWRQPSPWPEPKGSPPSPCPWCGTGGGGQTTKGRSRLSKVWFLQNKCETGPVRGWRSCWCSVQANFNDGDILAWPLYTPCSRKNGPRRAGERCYRMRGDEGQDKGGTVH